ncbi:MAG TPA: hypothetical protein VF054_09550 [Micromonosporaceae bacterium]
MDVGIRTGRVRRRRIAVAVGTVAALAVALGSVSVLVVPGRTVGSRPSVPARVYPPLPWQPTVADAPSGAAALLVTGTGRFTGSDAFGDFEDHVVAVGVDGSYRLVRFNTWAGYGDDVLLSPDGRFVAGDTSMEGTVDAPSTTMVTSVLDLTSGTVRSYDAGVPVAWSPDGSALLTRRGGDGADLLLLDLSSGRARRLVRIPGTTPAASYTAFSPDGRCVAIQAEHALYVVDLATGTQRQVIDLGARRRLAGSGAWLDGDRLAVWELDGCGASCDATDRRSPGAGRGCSDGRTTATRW